MFWLLCVANVPPAQYAHSSVQILWPTVGMDYSPYTNNINMTVLHLQGPPCTGLHSHSCTTEGIDHDKVYSVCWPKPTSCKAHLVKNGHPPQPQVVMLDPLVHQSHPRLWSLLHKIPHHCSTKTCDTYYTSFSCTRTNIIATWLSYKSHSFS